VSRSSAVPGRRSLEGLEWLARVGASTLEPWGLVMGWGRTVAYDHAVERRLNPARGMAVVPLVAGMALAGLAGFARS